MCFVVGGLALGEVPARFAGVPVSGGGWARTIERLVLVWFWELLVMGMGDVDGVGEGAGCVGGFLL